MRLGHIELFVRDPKKSLEFYRDVLGMEVIAIQGEQFIWLRGGAIELLLRPGSGAAEAGSYAAASTGLVLYTDDLKTTAEALRRRGLVFRGTDGSEHCLTFTDPDGHWYQLVNPDGH